MSAVTMSQVSTANNRGPKADKGAYPPSCGRPVAVASVFVGVDPGLSGAIAFFDAINGEFTVLDMPTRWITRNGKRRRQIDCVALGTLFDTYTAGRDVRAYVEAVHAMPRQGVSSTFSFGRAAGVIDGELGAQGVDPTYVQPKAWQKTFRLVADKDAHRGAAMTQWPKHAHLFQRNKDHNRADASLILAYGLQLQETCK